jgi:hypothetical protein
MEKPKHGRGRSRVSVGLYHVCYLLSEATLLMLFDSMFWRDSQLAELSAQTPPEPFIRPDEAQEGESMSVDGPPKPKRPPYLLVLPIPCLSSPLHPRQVLNDVLVPAIHGQKASFAYNARIGQSMQHEQATVEYETDGLTLLVKSACVSLSDLSHLSLKTTNLTLQCGT